MYRSILIIAAISGMIAVCFGAFGAHTIKEKISQEQLHTFETAVKYQFIHTLALLLVGILLQQSNSGLLTYSAIFFIIGIILFSGSLYILSTKTILGLENWKWIGPITPLGGLSFISGWVCIMLYAWKLK